MTSHRPGNRLGCQLPLTAPSLAALLALALVLHAPLPCAACVFKYGNLNGSAAEGMEADSHAGGSVWTYDFAGLDWRGVDAQGNHWVCDTGIAQSPINANSLKDFPHVPDLGRSIFDFGRMVSDGTNIQVINNGHTIQVEWNDPTYQPNASVAVPVTPARGPLHTVSQLPPSASPSDWTRIQLQPLQFHFHTHSEHMLEGALYPLEMHIVSRVPLSPPIPGCTGAMDCLVVVGIMIQVDPESEPHSTFDPIFSVMPLRGKVHSMLPTGAVLDFNNLLPANRTYITYPGSLTTPPCSEGVLWHVLTNPVTISLQQYEDFLLAVGDYYCNGTEIPPVALTPAEQADEEHDHGQGVNKRHLQASSHDHSHGSTHALRQRLLADTTSPAADNSTNATNMTGMCTKLGAGANYRLVQHLNTRPIRLYVDASQQPQQPQRPPQDVAAPPSQQVPLPQPSPSVARAGVPSGYVALIATLVAVGSAVISVAVTLVVLRRNGGKPYSSVLGGGKDGGLGFGVSESPNGGYAAGGAAGAAAGTGGGVGGVGSVAERDGDEAAMLLGRNAAGASHHAPSAV